MYVIIFSSIVSVLLAYLSQYKRFKQLHLFELGFAIVTFIACIRYNYGTDYSEYYDKFLNEYHFSNFWDFILDGGYKEPGWAILNYIFPTPYGFFALVAIISIFQNYIYYRLIKDNVHTSQRWFAMTIYLFSTSYWLLNMSMLRQGLAVTMGILAGQYIGNKRVIQAVIIIVLASLIHNSAIILLPFVVIGFLPLRKGYPYAIFILFLTLLLFFMKDIVSNMFLLSMDVETLQKYQEYSEIYEAGNTSLGAGFVLKMITYVIFVYFLLKRINEFSHTQKVYLILSSIAVLVFPFQIFISGLAGRMILFFSAFHVAMVPVVYHLIKSEVIRLSVKVIYIFMLIFGYYTFFEASSWASDSYTTYHTIFEVIFK